MPFVLGAWREYLDPDIYCTRTSQVRDTCTLHGRSLSNSNGPATCTLHLALFLDSGVSRDRETPTQRRERPPESRDVGEYGHEPRV